MSDPDMLRSHPDASYLLTLVEIPTASDRGAGEVSTVNSEDASTRNDDSSTLAACAVDVASGHMLIGQW